MTPRISIGLSPLLVTLFVTLKLTGVIAWSWWWVTAPLWLPLAAFVGGCGVVFTIGLVVAALS